MPNMAFRFPKPPEYYSTHMDLKMVVDRGTVWYDAPYTESGKRRYQRRKRKPRMTLYVRYRDQSIPLGELADELGVGVKSSGRMGMCT